LSGNNSSNRDDSPKSPKAYQFTTMTDMPKVYPYSPQNPFNQHLKLKDTYLSFNPSPDSQQSVQLPISGVQGSPVCYHI